MITFCSLSQVKHYKSDINILAARYCRSKLKDITHLVELAPSPELFTILKNCKSIDAFNTHRTRFLKEMDELVSQEKIKIICTALDEGLDVTVSCFCSDRNLCHTKFLADIFENKGYEVVLI